MIRILLLFVTLGLIKLQAGDLELATGDISQAEFSPDGKSISWIVKVDRKYQLFVRDSAGKNRQLLDGLYRRTFYSWSPDSTMIACTGKKGRKRMLHLINVKSGSDKVLLEGFNPAFMPDGKTLLFFSLTELCAYDLKSGKVRKLSDFKQRQSFERIAVSGKSIYFSCNGDLWSAALNKTASLLLDHKLKGSTQPFIQNPVVAPDGKYIYVSLITDGLYAMATDNVLGRYEFKNKKMERLTEANSWAMRPDGRELIYCLGGDLKTFPGKKAVCRGSEPAFSPNGGKLLYLVRTGWDEPAKLMLKTLTKDTAASKAGVLTEISYPCSSDNSMQKAMWYAPKAQKPVPLLVGLHTWSGNYKQGSGKAYYKEAKKRGWAFIFPNFRGPNKTPDAMCSDKAVQDIVDAVKYARQHANIAPDRIYLCGASGGGLMAMQMAGRHPEIWAGVSAWCGISNIKAWHAYNKKKKSGYYKHIESALQGSPDTDQTAAKQAERRSPVTWLKNAKGLPLDIWHGAKDRVVPSTEGQNAFAAVTGKPVPNDREHPDKIGKCRILSRKTADNTRLTIFDSGHTIFYPVAIEWLSFQRKGKPAVWKTHGTVTGSNEIER